MGYCASFLFLERFAGKIEGRKQQNEARKCSKMRHANALYTLSLNRIEGGKLCEVMAASDCGWLVIV